MSAGLQRFDGLLACAEAAAASFDGRGLQAAMADLSAHVDALGAVAALQPQELAHMRARLVRYQHLCTFLQETLHQALLGALSQQSVPCYDAASRQHTVALSPLIRRYI